MRLHIALYEPEIPPNTGNVIRLCANTGAILHLIEPLGFTLEHAKLRRAGLDYHEFTRVNVHRNWASCLEAVQPGRVLAFSTKARRRYDELNFVDNDLLLYGPETRGLPTEILTAVGPDHCLRIPMQPGSRSLNLANTVALSLYEAWRQLGFPGGN